MDFEKKLKRLEEIVEAMEDGELALEKSLQLFEEGVKLTKDCHLQLNEAEQKVKILVGVSDDGAPQTKDFLSNERN